MDYSGYVSDSFYEQNHNLPNKGENSTAFWTFRYLDNLKEYRTDERLNLKKICRFYTY
jgi:hypothetical protein